MFSNGTVDFDTMLDELPPLRPDQHDRVRALKDELKEKKDELEDLKRRRRGRYGRIQALEEEFKAALKGESDRDPREIREERLEVEEEKDRFQEKRTKLKYEIAELEQEVQEATREVAREVEDLVEEPWTELHADFAEALQEATRAALRLQKAFGDAPRRHRLPGLDSFPADWPHDCASVASFCADAKKRLLELQKAGYDIDPDLIEALNDL